MCPSATDTPAQRARRKALVRQLVEEGVNQGRLEVVDAVRAPTCRAPLPDGKGPYSLLPRRTRGPPRAAVAAEATASLL